MSYNTYPQNPFPPNSENAGGGGSPYVLPVASANTLGGVKVGSNLTIDENGVLSALASAPNFSTNEQETGQKWVDGKDIYFRTVELDNSLSLPSQAWTSTGISGSGIETILHAFGVDQNGTYFVLYATPNASSTGNIGFLQTRSVDVSITKFVVYYTKATV